MPTTLPDIQPICQRATTPAEKKRLIRGLRRGTYTKPYRGIYAPAQEWSDLDALERTRHLVRTMGDAHPGWVFCFFSAAAVYGLEVGKDNALLIHACTPRSTSKTANPLLVRHEPCERKPQTVCGVRVTPPLQTAIDCLLELDFSRGLAVADSALRILGLTKKELLDELASRGGHPRRTSAKNAILNADGRAENGGESVARGHD